MTRIRTAQNPRALQKTISAEEIANGTARLHEVLDAINDFSQEGFPYRDAARTKAELQLRECVKHIFGEDSDEFQTYRNYKLRTSSKAETSESITAVKSLIRALEERKSELPGATPPPVALSSTAKTGPVKTAQIRPVPPTTPSKPSTQPPPRSAPPGGPAATETNPRMSVVRSTQPVPAPSSSPTSKIQKVTVTPPVSRPASPPPKPAPAKAVQTGPAPVPSATQQIRQAQAAASPSTTQQIRPTPAASPPAEVPASASMTQRVRPAQAPSSPSTTQQIRPTLATSPPAEVPASVSATQQIRPPASPSSTQEIPSPTASSPQPATPAAAVVPTSPDLPSFQSNPELDTLQLIRKVCLRFHAVARQLRLRKDSRPTVEIEDDYDLLDLLRALLKMEFDEVGVDEWTPPYAGSLSRTALLLNREQLVVVAKKTRSGLTAKEIAEQITADSAFYSARNKCTALFCFVYDPEGRIGSPKRLETDLTSVSDRYMVEVLVAPK